MFGVRKLESLGYSPVLIANIDDVDMSGRQTDIVRTDTAPRHLPI